jgi:hypothetical protein
VKVQLFEINASRVSGVDQLFDLLGFVAIRLRKFAPHTGREIRQPVRMVRARVIVRAIEYRFDEMGDAFSSSATARTLVSAKMSFDSHSIIQCAHLRSKKMSTSSKRTAAYRNMKVLLCCCKRRTADMCNSGSAPSKRGQKIWQDTCEIRLAHHLVGFTSVHLPALGESTCERDCQPAGT